MTFPPSVLKIEKDTNKCFKQKSQLKSDKKLKVEIWWSAKIHRIIDTNLLENHKRHTKSDNKDESSLYGELNETQQNQMTNKKFTCAGKGHFTLFLSKMVRIEKCLECVLFFIKNPM